jgi:hypothetical protein
MESGTASWMRVELVDWSLLGYTLTNLWEKQKHTTIKGIECAINFEYSQRKCCLLLMAQAMAMPESYKYQMGLSECKLGLFET